MNDIGQILQGDTILIAPSAQKKSELLKLIVERICKVHPEIPLNTAFQAVMEREKVSSTFMDSGLAVPHARLPQINGIIAGLAILPAGFEDAKSKISKTHFIFLFLSSQNEFNAHLQTLSRATWLFQNNALKENLVKATDPSTILNLIRDAEKEIPNGSTA